MIRFDAQYRIGGTEYQMQTNVGPRGPQGPQGPKGEGYSLTEADIAEISGVVSERISKYSLKVDSGGYIAVEYKG